MLIINADDWGYDAATTDSIVDVYRASRVTSATAMVYMRDSLRAASLASRESLPVGLHLNLMEPFSDLSAPSDVRNLQSWVASRYRTGYRRRWLPAGELFLAAHRCIEDQLSAFRELYGEPTHVDGHQHGHLSSAALWALGSEKDRPIRRGFTFRPSDKGLLKRTVRRGFNRSLDIRFKTTDEFHSLHALHPRLGGHGLEDIVRLAQSRSVEIMVHPAIPEEYEILMSNEWANVVSGAPLGSYLDLTNV
jgi:chitin disaccharide deacetylase